MKATTADDQPATYDVVPLVLGDDRPFAQEEDSHFGGGPMAGREDGNATFAAPHGEPRTRGAFVVGLDIERRVGIAGDELAVVDADRYRYLGTHPELGPHSNRVPTGVLLRRIRTRAG